MTTAMALPAGAPLMALLLIVAQFRAFMGDILRPGLTVFAFSEGEGGGGAGEEGGSGGGGAGTGDGGGSEDEGDDEDDDDEEIKDLDSKAASKLIRKLRGENKGLRARSKTAESELRTLKTKDLPEAERLKVEADEAKASVAAANKRIVDSEIKVAAASAGVVDPDAVVALITREGIELDDSGRVTGVKKALDALLKEKPYLKSEGNGSAGRSGSDGGGSGERQSPGSGMDNLIRQAAGFK